jgi:hypothetical protein
LSVGGGSASSSQEESRASRAGAFEKVHKDDVSSLLQRLVVFPLLIMSERKLEMTIWRWKSELLAERFDAIV